MYLSKFWLVRVRLEDAADRLPTVTYLTLKVPFFVTLTLPADVSAATEYEHVPLAKPKIAEVPATQTFEPALAVTFQ